MARSPLRNLSKDFAKQIVTLCLSMKDTHGESVLINQLLYSGTSIGANLQEAQYTQDTREFISKLEMAQKDCYVTAYWLELLLEAGFISDEQHTSMQSTCNIIRRMLMSSLSTARFKMD